MATRNRKVATAEDGQVTLTLAHHFTDTEGILATDEYPAGSTYGPGAEVTVSRDLARQLASAGLVAGVDPLASGAVAELVGDTGVAAPVEGQG